jgi:hypothetical protein
LSHDTRQTRRRGFTGQDYIIGQKGGLSQDGKKSHGIGLSEKDHMTGQKVVT